MTRALFTLWLSCAIVYATDVVSGQSLEVGSGDVHSVVVDMPRAISLPPASPEAWETWWASVPSMDHLDDQRLTTDQVAQNSDRLAAATW